MNGPNGMDGHFRAFTFVDRITQPGVHARGVYQIPAGISEFPISLVAARLGHELTVGGGRMRASLLFFRHHFLMAAHRFKFAQL